MFDATLLQEIADMVEYFEVTDEAMAEIEAMCPAPAPEIPVQMPYSSKLASRISLSVFESLD